MAKMFLSQGLPSIVVVSFAISFTFFTIICATATTKTKYLFHEYDLGVIAETNHSLSFYEDGGKVDCHVYPRNSPMTESHEAKPAIVIVSEADRNNPDLPFTFSCVRIKPMGMPVVTICRIGMTPDNDGICREIAE